MKTSAILVVYNEERHIHRCLKSIVDVVDEIIVVHDGECEDKSVEIAKSYGAIVFRREHQGMREFHQVFALQKCKYDWILQIDADEFLSDKLKSEIKSLTDIEANDAYEFVWALWNGKEYFTKGFPHKKVLFRKNKMYYFSFPGKDPGTYGKLITSELILEHRPVYNNYTLKTFRKKWVKWIKVHAKFFYKQNFEQYQCTDDVLNDFNKKIEQQKIYAKPYLAIGWMIQSILVSFFRHHYWKSVRTWKVALLQGLYGYYLCLYIWKYRK